MSSFDRSALVVAITGGIACGKSEVGRILGEMGFAVCDADRVAHGLMVKGSPVFHRVVECFGKRILTEDGEISRPLLGKIIFENPEKRLRLNCLVHPAVKNALKEWICERRSSREKAAVQIPLLFESGMDDLGWDAIICVSSSEQQVFERMRNRGIEQAEALKRMDSQMPLSEKERLSDRVIHNLGTLRELEKATRITVESLMAER